MRGHGLGLIYTLLLLPASPASAWHATNSARRRFSSSTTKLCLSSCAGTLQSQYQSCVSNPATYRAAVALKSVRDTCNVYQCIQTAQVMTQTVNQLCCSSGTDCTMADVCDMDCANTFVAW